MTASIHGAIGEVRGQMDDFVIGHKPVKEAMLLALIAREHIYVQGEPGCAKTLLAEITANTANLNFHFSQMHRDTRLTDLVGDVVLKRSILPNDGGEVIEQSLLPGGMLTSEVVLLDDICRAPGEALNVLLRVLNERQFQNKSIPLMSAIATTNPTEDEYYNEPLDPANLDRFTFQIKTQGALATSDWEDAREIVDRYEGLPAEMRIEGRVDGEQIKKSYDAHQAVGLPAEVVAAYVKILDDLRNRYGCTPANSLLTDRTMLVKVPRMIKAMAFLNGRDVAEKEDLRVLKYILTFRVPEDVYENIDQIIDQAIEESEQQEQAEPEEGEQMQGAQEQEEQGAGSEEEDSDGEGENALIQEILDTLQAETQKTEAQKSVQQQAAGGEQSGKVTRSTPQNVENMEFLLDKIRGRLERNPAEMEVHPGGSPRSFRRMRSFEDFMDADHVDTAIWLDRLNPNLPRSFHRKKKHMGGRVIIVRDVSQSMEGRYARWTSSVVTKLVDMVRRKRMRVGYIEFNHVSHKYQHDGRFFTRDYDKIVDTASNVTCSGVTNYQYPLRDALEEFKKGRSDNKHILFLTDGEPTQGDWLVREERRNAKGMGVSVHTLFIGTTECPEILDILSEETDGSKFLATPNDKGGLVIEERAERTMLDRYLRKPEESGKLQDDVSSASRHT